MRLSTVRSEDHRRENLTRLQLLQSMDLYSILAWKVNGGEGKLSSRLIWNGRVGFAEVAKECGVPVIPMFQVNSQQAMPVATYGLRGIRHEAVAKFALYLTFLMLGPGEIR